MRSPRAFLDTEELTDTTKTAVAEAMRTAAAELMEKARNSPAPCGCTPKARCDRHCRVRITSRRDEDGDLIWDALCNGGLMEPRCAAAHGDLDRVHDWSTGHVTYHRKLSREGQANG
jgi:hypothetical protein